jgi:hypothetical protein
MVWFPQQVKYVDVIKADNQIPIRKKILTILLLLAFCKAHAAGFTCYRLEV